MDDLKKQAAELGINVDNRWGEDRLREEIDKALAAPSKASGDKSSGKTVPVRIKRDIWDKDGNRHRKGTVIELSVEEAMDAVEAGSVSRVKD